jgi:hypothetical protein
MAGGTTAQNAVSPLHDDALRASSLWLALSAIVIMAMRMAQSA